MRIHGKTLALGLAHRSYSPARRAIPAAEVFADRRKLPEIRRIVWGNGGDRPLRRSVGSLFLVLLLFGFAFGAQRLLKEAWESLGNYRSPYLTQSPADQGSTPLTDAVVIVVISGLREDASDRMPALEYLRSRGATLSVKLGLPSLAMPSWATLLTGAGPEIHEVTANSFSGPLRADHIFEAARRANLTTGLVGTKQWQTLLGPAIGEGRFLDPKAPDPDGQAVERAAALLETTPSLALLNVTGPAVTGGQFGADSGKYLQAVSEADSRLAMILDLVDLENMTVIVTSDYGLTDAGGHGGGEDEVIRLPLVMAGLGIRSGATAAIGQEDIAPTIAALLGIPFPANATGQPVWAALDASDEVLKEKLTLATAQLAAVKAATLTALGDSGPLAPPSEPNPSNLGRWLESTRIREDNARNKLLGLERQERLPRMGWALGGGLVLLIVLTRAVRGPIMVRAAGTYLVSYYLIFFLRGNRYSLSTLTEPGSIPAFFLARAWEGALAMALGSLVIGWCLARRGPWRPRQVVLSSLAGALAVVVIIALQALVPVFLHGFKIQAGLAANPWTIKYYLDLLQVFALGYLAPAWPAVGLIGAKIGSLGKSGHGPVREPEKVSRRSRPARPPAVRAPGFARPGRR